MLSQVAVAPGPPPPPPGPHARRSPVSHPGPATTSEMERLPSPGPHGPTAPPRRNPARVRRPRPQYAPPSPRRPRHSTLPAAAASICAGRTLPLLMVRPLPPPTAMRSCARLHLPGAWPSPPSWLRAVPRSMARSSTASAPALVSLAGARRRLDALAAAREGAAARRGCSTASRCGSLTGPVPVPAPFVLLVGRCIACLLSLILHCIGSPAPDSSPS
ncbi:hypothetical protein PVAP13_5NG596107 [Panicum virgatum]|uniref:Uncharacterized protein n=1 Tax=Panicum virgatum TaxID=38727 RepID=A0A8T0SBG1_PANVG|nr:hypothetical protein PVAP13_5NG596107 [Panicum virgatum]